ncbi:MAG TPA: hypothetical protein VLQ66_01050 [Paenisporosarcina sp.]|nr:hypothetical protein [Paenisporosarcina sp.]
MNLIKHSSFNLMFIVVMSFLYSFLFIFTSNHLEFTRLLSKNSTLSSSFWNNWSDFIRTGNMKYVGYFIIVLTIIILILAFIKRAKEFDEYQVSILSRSVLIAGILSIGLVPIVMIFILSDPNYTIAVMFLFATIQWLSVLVTYFFYTLKN